jgi:hypothetical protein
MYIETDEVDEADMEVEGDDDEMQQVIIDEVGEYDDTLDEYDEVLLDEIEELLPEVDEV